jgi:hypothetical protein
MYKNSPVQNKYNTLMHSITEKFPLHQDSRIASLSEPIQAKVAGRWFYLEDGEFGPTG